ncbi:TonB-dependent receptor domain-containing protein [Crocinitomix algicola]|uniref:TonB-dependent receptor domain-containing protein n=1 Tax=Crocinitomix algicola TaxID=1740263 RepID=UPI00082CC593|nr:TonB-dependent receptor [Crocinitomix algicola]
MKNLIWVLFGLISISGFAQEAEKGFIRGTVYEAASGETMPGVKVEIIGRGQVAKTDLDGQFSVSIEPGEYSIQFSFFYVNTLLIENVVVTAGETNYLENLNMEESSNELTKIVVYEERTTNTENAILHIKKKNPNMIDGISSSSFRKIGDSDAAGAMTRVPGVSVSGGKYVYIRGLGDRYNKTLLNGMDVPGLDPDKNTIQMDIFPTNILDNIIVNKSFSAELPADFAGGVIDISLKSFPEEKQRKISVGTGFNPYFHFNKDYLTYDGGKTDFLGFDDGSRAIPATENIPFFSEAIGDPEKADRYKEILGKFNPVMGAYQQMSLMDYSLSGSFGNQIKKGEKTIGYSGMFSYKNNTEFYKEAIFARYGLSGDPDEMEMQTREYQTGSYGVNNVLLTAMGGMAIKSASSKYTFNVLHLQNGESKAGIFDYLNSDQGAIFQGYQHNLEYSQRSLTNVLFSGKHNYDDNDWEIDWRIAPTLSLIKDPDIRFTRYEERDDTLIIGTEAGFPERIWRELVEKNVAGKIGATKEFKAWERDAKLKFGGGYTFKTRDFVIRNFAMNVRNVNLTGDPNELFTEENIWPHNGDIGKGTTYEVSFLPSNPNQYSSNVHNASAYISTEVSPTKRIKAVIGLRAESYTQFYTGQDQLGLNVLRNDVVLQDLGIFPSLNLVYQVTDRQNLRFSYGITTARPSFKELSYAEIYDPVSGRTFIGGLFKDEDAVSGNVYWDGELEVTDIHNIDVRWETFNSPGQTISITAFYKKFYNPIEIVQFSAQVGSFQPRNVGDGELLGGEFEMRQGLKFISEKMQNFSFNLNLTYTLSRILYSDTEKESRVANARTGQEIGDYRDMAGQAPYLINGGLAYNGGAEGFAKGLEVGVYYNVQGRTLQYVGIVDRPDIYSVPFHSLNFNANKTFGKNEQYQFGLKVSNLLNDEKETMFRSINAQDQIFSKLAPGTTAAAKFSIKF